MMTNAGTMRTEYPYRQKTEVAHLNKRNAFFTSEIRFRRFRYARNPAHARVTVPKSELEIHDECQHPENAENRAFFI